MSNSELVDRAKDWACLLPSDDMELNGFAELILAQLRTLDTDGLDPIDCERRLRYWFDCLEPELSGEPLAKLQAIRRELGNCTNLTERA